MFHWFLIFLGIIILTISISNPFYKLTVNRYFKLNIFYNIFIRIMLFFIGLLIIFLGLYVESIV